MTNELIERNSPNELEAVIKFTNEVLIPYVNKETTQQSWREQRFRNEQCDNFIKSHSEILQNSFMRYC